MTRFTAVTTGMRGPAIAAAVFGCLYWAANLFYFLKARRALRVLGDLAPREPARYPRLSLVVPACNEAATVEAAVASRLADDYPDLEVVLVDDRSTDGTGAILDRLATSDPRVRALHLTELPPGWLGKVHAMDQGARAATGDFLLFSDADVHVAKGTLRRTVAWAEERRLDMLAVAPGIVAPGYWISTVLAAFVRTLLVATRSWAVEEPGSKAYLGVGAFNLVRRSAFARTAAFAWLRLEVGDDFGLGLLMKRAGHRCAVLNGRGCVTVEWYPTLRAMIAGAERAAFSTCDFRLWRALTLAGGYLAAEFSFTLAFLPVGLPWLPALGATALSLALLTSWVACRWSWIDSRTVPLFWVGTLLQVYMVARAGVLGALRGGIVWRGTLYRSEELRPGRRLRLGA
ncbi:MAG: glycosyltransferase family 2 protein [Myxococcales bacterium]